MNSSQLFLVSFILSAGLRLVAASNSIRMGWAAFPSSPLYYSSYDDYSQILTESLFEPLIELSPNDLSPQARLAKNWKISPNKLQIQFSLHPDAKFSDGSSVKASDVCFTFNWLKNSRHAPAFKTKFSPITQCTVTDPRVVVFKANKPRFETLFLFTELFILPEHSFLGFKDSIPFDSTLFGSGPYQIVKVEKPTLVVLKRNSNYWGQSLLINKARFHFDELNFKVVSDPQMLHQHLLRHEIDFMYFLSSKMWATETHSEPYTNGNIKKREIKNKLPYSTVALAWNLRRPLFQNPKVRLALAHLLNRRRILKDLMYDAYIPATGIQHSLSDWHHPKNLAVEYSPELALKLLGDAGWTLREKQLINSAGIPFSFEILISNPGSAKYLTFYQEDLKKLGIEMRYKIVDWATFLKNSREGNFDAIETARERELIPHDFASTWGSKNANLQGSGNTTGYQNTAVDKLIQKIESSFNETQRKKLIQDLDLVIAQEQPLNFLWEPTYTRIAHWDDFSSEGEGYFAYSSWKSLFHYWKKKPEMRSKLTQLK